jgi:hypothetical protein
MRSAFSVFFAVLLAPVVARADPARTDESVAHARTDTSYGRIDGDVSAIVGLGASFGPRAPRAALDLRFRYLDTVGVFFGYEDGALFGGDAEPLRVVATGVELRPLFIGRWLTGRESARARLDLLLDSFGLELGAAFVQPTGSSLGSRPSLQAGLGLEIPILASARGPWIGLHGGARWNDAALRGDSVLTPSDRAMFGVVTLAWHEFFLAHAVDAGDRAPR